MSKRRKLTDEAGDKLSPNEMRDLDNKLASGFKVWSKTNSGSLKDYVTIEAKKLADGMRKKPINKAKATVKKKSRPTKASNKADAKKISPNSESKDRLKNLIGNKWSASRSNNV